VFLVFWCLKKEKIISRERETRAIKRKDRGDKIEKIIIRNSCDLLIKRKKGEKKMDDRDAGC